MSNNADVTQFCEDLYTAGDRSPFLLALIVDMCDEQITLGGKNPLYSLDRAKELCHDLANTHDTIRCKYWEYMASTIEKKANGETETPSEATGDCY